MSLQIHRAERADRLVDALGELLSAPLADPFATEIVSVPTRGVERWLAQSLATRLGSSPDRTDGICAGVRVPVPAPARQRGAGHGRSQRSGDGPVAAPARGLAAARGDRRGPGRALGRRAVVLPRVPHG